MYVCLCMAVTDRQILEAVDNGAHTVTELANTCGAGTVCGCCRQITEELITERLATTRPCAA